MPVKRRNAKRRIDPELELEIWGGILTSGYDFFDELPRLGVASDEYGRPDREAARAAWHRHGERILAEYDPRLRLAWAEEQFGRPWETSHAD